MDVDADPSRTFADHGTVLQRVVDTLDGVVLHADQEARAELGVGRARIEEGGRCMCEVPFRHKIVRLNDAIEV